MYMCINCYGSPQPEINAQWDGMVWAELATHLIPSYIKVKLTEDVDSFAPPLPPPPKFLCPSLLYIQNS